MYRFADQLGNNHSEILKSLLFICFILEQTNKTYKQTKTQPPVTHFLFRFLCWSHVQTHSKRGIIVLQIQFEIVHNALHSFLGGRGEYSLSSLDYSAFDPVFFLHHANVDRIWAIWQALQRFRKLPFDETDCGVNLMGVPLHPFDDQEENQFDLTHKYSRPADVFDYSGHLEYHYDTLRFNSWTIPQLNEVLKQQR